MISSIINRRKRRGTRTTDIEDIADSLIRSRNLFNTQTLSYDLLTVTSLDIDDSNTFVLVGLSNGGVDLLEIEDLSEGRLATNTRMNFSQFNLNRVQWSPSNEQFFSVVDNHDLYLIDPVEMRPIEKFDFTIKTNWSEWNPNDHKIIAVCGSESQVRLVDVASGSSAQTIVLGAPSRLASHRATRCLWTKHDLSCLVVGDNEGYLHVYDTRHTTRPLHLAGEECGQISGMSFTHDNCSIVTSQGTENRLVQWNWNKCQLVPNSEKFRKRRYMDIMQQTNHDDPDIQQSETNQQIASTEVNITPMTRHEAKRQRRDVLTTTSSTQARRSGGRPRAPLPVDAYLRCQFHVTDRHVLCPVSSRTMKSKEIHIYDVKTGERIETIKSEGILNQGVYSVSSLMPQSMAIFVGGRGRLRVWNIDEGYQRKLEEKLRLYHLDHWESDDE